MHRCLQCLECGCKVWYVQMLPDVVLECRECGLELSLFTYSGGYKFRPMSGWNGKSDLILPFLNALTHPLTHSSVYYTACSVTTKLGHVAQQ